MAPVKRKGATADDGPSRHPQKRIRVGDERKKKEKKQKITSSRPSMQEQSNKSMHPAPSSLKDSELSIVRDEEPAFPRGGANVLTPLERKQIQIQATRDVLFKDPGRSAEGLIEEDDDADIEMKGRPKEITETKKSRKVRPKGNKTVMKEVLAKQDVRIEGLSFKVCPAP
jgi:rRNA biogenesis protein RRP5